MVASYREEIAGPDKAGLDHVRFEVAEHRTGEHRGAAFAQTEQGEMRPAEEIEKTDGRAGGGVDQRRFRRLVARPGTVDRFAV